ncbi:MAG: hypothetical protein ACTSQI_08590 [Candidatus Helarchaeota archaeon]
MSRDFASFMASISGDSAEQRITELMEILDKVMQIIMNSVDNLTERVFALENNINTSLQRVANLEARPTVAVPASGIAPNSAAPAPMAPPPPKPEPKPLSPMSARAALQSELKQLFARRKQS